MSLGGIVAAAESNPPNVIIVFIDDQGYYDLGCYGATEVKTPRIDQLADNGVRFTDYYAAGPICSPSRAGLMTGCYPRRSGNEIWVHRPDSEDGIPAEFLTMAELFRDAGYATACIGKWHLGFQEEYLPWNQGFDYYYGILHNLDEYEAFHFEDVGGVPLQRNQEILEWGTEPGVLTGKFTDEAINWIAQQKEEGKPFFLYMPHTMLHVPLGVSPQFVGTSNWGLYGDAIQELDFQVGRLLDALKEMGINENTIVVYSSDNGRGPGRNDNQPLRGEKLATDECGIRVPAIVSGPGVRKGFDSDVVAHAMDWYPTLASMAGIAIPDDVILDGRDLSALLAGKTDEIPAFDSSVSINAEVPLRRKISLDREWTDKFTRDEYLNAFFYHGSHGALAAVRAGPYKLTLHPNLMLFNIEEDPAESTELVGARPKKGEDSNLTPLARQRAENRETKTKLRGMVIQFQREMNAWHENH